MGHQFGLERLQPYLKGGDLAGQTVPQFARRRRHIAPVMMTTLPSSSIDPSYAISPRLQSATPAGRSKVRRL